MADDIIKSESAPLVALGQAHGILPSVTAALSSALQTATTPKEVAFIHEWTKKAEESFKAFTDSAKARLKDMLITQGKEVTENGTLELDLGEGRVQRAIPTNTKPDAKLVAYLLASKGLSPAKYMIPKPVEYKVDEGILKVLVADGKITQTELDECYKAREYRIGKTTLKGEDDE